MSSNSKFPLYIAFVVIISILGYFIYNAFGFNKFHTQNVKLFCNEWVENIGVTNTRSVEALKNYVADKERFNQMDSFKIKNFFADTARVPGCSDAVLFSKRYNGARSVKVKMLNSEEVITVLSEHVEIIEE